MMMFATPVSSSRVRNTNPFAVPENFLAFYQVTTALPNEFSGIDIHHSSVLLNTGSMSKIMRSGRSSRSARLVHACGVMQFWFASHTSVAGENVDENRARLAATVGAPRERFLYGRQVHEASMLSKEHVAWQHS